MAKDNRKHHLVAASYLAGFATPQKKSGRVWVMGRDFNIYAGSPLKVLRDTDFYLIRNPDGSESLEVEREYLSGIEGLYATNTMPKILANQSLDESDKAVLSLMAANMLARSPALRASEQDFFQRLKATMDTMNALPEETKRQMAGFNPPINEEDRIPGETVQEIAADVSSWHTESIPTMTSHMFPYIQSMKCNVIVNKDPDSLFITSDSPCIMVNPELEKHYGRGNMMSSAGLAQKNVEITLPLTATHAIMFGYLMTGDLQYVPMGKSKSAMLETVNGRTTRRAHYIVSNSKDQLETIKARAQQAINNEQQ